MKYYNYTDLGIVSAKKPTETHLLIETAAGVLYMADSSNTDDIIKSTNKGETWSSLSVPGDDLVVKGMFFDLAENRIWYYAYKNDYMYHAYIDTTNDNEQWVFKGQSTGGNTGYDVLHINALNYWMYVFDDDTGGVNDGKAMLIFLDFPIVGGLGTDMGAYGGRTHDASFVADDGSGNGWFLWQWSDEDVELWKFDESVPSLTQMTLAGGGSFVGASIPADRKLQGVAYENGILSFIVVIGGVNTLHIYSIADDELISLGVYDVSIQLEKNTAVGVQEKAFHITEYEVYQLHQHSHQLHLIAVPATDAVIITITDNFLMNDDGDMFEYEDQLDFIKTVMIHHQVQEASECQFTLVKDTIPIEKNLFVRFLHEFTTAAGVPILYRGTYNFKDEEDGTSRTDIAFITADFSGTNATTIIETSKEGHKKIIKGTNVNPDNYRSVHTLSTPQGDGYVEFWILTDDISKGSGAGVWITNNGPSFAAGNLICVLEFRNNNLNLQYGNGAGGTSNQNLGAATNNTWYHIKVYLDFAADQITAYVNGVIDVARNFINDNTFTNFNTLTLHAATDGNFSGWYDAFGFSWDTDYTVGDNLMEEAEEEIVFEGIVIDFTEMPNQTVWCVSLAKRELKVIKPSGDYTVDSDGLISDLITDFCSYITKGTLTDGADLGTISLGGNQTLETILDDCAEFEGWIWYLTPTGVLYFNNGTVDSTINYTEANDLVSVTPSHTHEEFNRIKVRGAYVDGVQVESAWQEDVASQQRIGINERIIDVTFLNTVALCNFAAANLLTILAKDPKKAGFALRDTTTGMIQVGETITFEYSDKGIVIASDQYLIRNVIITKFGITTYTIMDELS